MKTGHLSICCLNLSGVLCKTRLAILRLFGVLLKLLKWVFIPFVK